MTGLQIMILVTYNYRLIHSIQKNFHKINPEKKQDHGLTASEVEALSVEWKATLTDTEKNPEMNEVRLQHISNVMHE